MRVLVIRFSAMGDVALTVPAVISVLEAHPDLKITFLTNKMFAPFFFGIKNLDVMTADLKGRHRGIFGVWRLARELGSFDFVADLHNVLRSRLLCFFLGAKNKKIDKGRAEKRELVRRENKSLKSLKHSSERYLDVFAELGFEAKLNLNAMINVEASPKLTEFKGALPFGEAVVKIGVAPFAKHFTKMWPLEKARELVEQLKERPEVVVVLLCGPGEEAESIRDLQADNCILLTGNLSFSDELAFIRELDIVVSMDSANMHLASLSGVKLVSIWGGTHTSAGFSPLGPQEKRQVEISAQKLSCRPCSVFGRGDCPEGHFNCMKKIEVPQVLGAIDELLNY